MGGPGHIADQALQCFPVVCLDAPVCVELIAIDICQELGLLLEAALLGPAALGIALPGATVGLLVARDALALRDGGLGALQEELAALSKARIVRCLVGLDVVGWRAVGLVVEQATAAQKAADPTGDAARERFQVRNLVGRGGEEPGQSAIDLGVDAVQERRVAVR